MPGPVAPVAPVEPLPSAPELPWWQRPLEEQVEIVAREQRPPRSLGQVMERLRSAWGIERAAMSGELETESDQKVAPDGRPWCDTCSGLRWVGKNLAIGDPDFGKLERCPDCPPVAQDSHRKMLARAAGLVEAQHEQTFDTFRSSRGVQDALEAARSFAEAPRGWLVINGQGGSGKTHLSVAIANTLVERLQSVLWRYAPDLVAEVLDENFRLDRFRLQRFIEVPILIVDELGAASGWVVGTVLEPLFDGRYRRRLPTVVTMMASPSKVRAQYSDAIGRRFEDAQLCRVVPNLASPWSPGRLRVLP